MTNSDPVVLLVEGDIVVRHPLATYLRECGFKVLETSSGEEARNLLLSSEFNVEVVLADISTAGCGFELMRWVREHNGNIQVIMAGSIDKAVDRAASICEEGPALAKPYEHHLVLDHIRRALAQRNRAKNS